MRKQKKRKNATASRRKSLAEKYARYFSPFLGATNGKDGVSLEYPPATAPSHTTVSYGLLDVPPLTFKNA